MIYIAKMADSCANLCSANSSQILANSLLDFTNDSVNVITNNDDIQKNFHCVYLKTRMVGFGKEVYPS